jgi:inosine-uridine nucleoside N-ribohydrolase
MKLLPLLILGCMSAQGAVPVILDTDIGDDIDDTWALCMMLGSPEVDVKLITIASDNTPKKCLVAAKILEAVGRTDIPLGIGKQTSGNAIHQEAWVGDFTLEGYKGKVHQDGVQALIDTVHGSPAPLTLCVIGPQTNLAEALRRDPSYCEEGARRVDGGQRAPGLWRQGGGATGVECAARH